MSKFAPEEFEQLVAQALGRGNPDNVFIGGLMQNIGQLVLARSHPEMFQDILNESAERELPYHIVERGRLGFDHGELGALLIQEWNLSQELEDAVRWHHRFDHDSAQSQRTAAIDHHIRRQLHIGSALTDIGHKVDQQYGSGNR